MKTIDRQIRRIVGKKIIDIRYQTIEEKNKEGWYRRAPVLVLEDGTTLFPSKDDEGNDAGTLFGRTKTEQSFVFPVARR